MDHSLCPLCNTEVPSQEIQWHVNDHLDAEEFSRDLALAQEIELAPPPPQVESESSSFRDARVGSDIGGKISSLISFQVEEIFHQVEGGLIASLKNCLASGSEKDATSIVSGYVDHFQSREFEDVGWGCGWRNIQMLSSHLIKQRPEAKECLFGGAGFVPDIASLQRWLEIAWELGFDTQGSKDFDREIYGKRNWIGTTECAALFRSFGLRAMVVDFYGKGLQLTSSVTELNNKEMLANQNTRIRKVAQVYGPMDRFLNRVDHKDFHGWSTGDEGFRQSSGHVGKAKSHGNIIDWVWNYFSDNNSIKPGSRHVVLSEKAPLYFQHDGHSRTIVGIQAIRRGNEMHQYNLLILDPAHQTEALEKSLKQKFGWQKLIKRGVHTLKKQQYQLCFVEPGVASGKEIDQLKIIRGIRFQI